MVRINNLTEYKPDYVLDEMSDVIFLQDDMGNDWYYALQRFKPDTMKVCFDKQGVIMAFNGEADKLWPVGLSVAEVAKKAVPSAIAIDGKWVFDGAAVVPRTYSDAERVEQADKKRVSLITNAVADMSPLLDAVELGRATPEQAARLLALKNYRLDLIELDISDPDAIAWPVLRDVA